MSRNLGTSFCIRSKGIGTFAEPSLDGSAVGGSLSVNDAAE
jgi:hypothetical protein